MINFNIPIGNCMINFNIPMGNCMINFNIPMGNCMINFNIPIVNCMINFNIPIVNCMINFNIPIVNVFWGDLKTRDTIIHELIIYSLNVLISYKDSVKTHEITCNNNFQPLQRKTNHLSWLQNTVLVKHQVTCR